MAHSEVPAEQAHVDLAYRRLEEMRAAADSRLREAFEERGGTFQSVTERDIRVRSSLARLEQLDIGHESLVFGRIDRAARPASCPDGAGAGAGDGGAGDGAGGAPDAAADGAGEAFHIGRVAVSDHDLTPLVVDWRAPVAEPFYRATGAQPMGLRRRRHFLTEGRKVADLEDELFDVDGEEPGAGLGLAGPQVLRAALERSRTGRMRDIVATVQREQDEVIRSPLAGILVVQGGPGTGKTAVALHRAAYLLYTHRFPLEGQGVLVVGPTPVFLRYIEHVLPSLGESGVQLSTVNGLYPGLAGRRLREDPAARRRDDEPTARLKGDARMARVIAKAVADRQRPLRQVAEIPYGSRILRLTPAASARLVASARRRPGSHNARRRSLEALLWRHLAALADAVDGADAASGAARADAVGTGAFGPGAVGAGADVFSSGATPGVEQESAEELGRVLRRQPEMVEALERMWPRLTPEDLLRDLFGARPLLELATAGILQPEEARLLIRDRAESSWSDADLALLDEALALLGPRRPPRPGVRSGTLAPPGAPPDGEAQRTWGHVVVDEAQDLTPMQLRMIARRCSSGSMTVVGDLAQATGPWAPASWGQVVEHLSGGPGASAAGAGGQHNRPWRQADLTVNYRTPSEVMELASRVLAAAVPGISPPEPVRSSGERPVLVSALDAAALDGGAVPQVAVPRSVAAAVSEELSRPGGANLAVIAPPSLVAAVARSLEEAGVAYGDSARGALDERVSLLAVEDAKGLEFDSVVVVEPARLAEEAAQGLRALYVALTRATRRLVVVHSGRLPEALAAGAHAPA